MDRCKDCKFYDGKYCDQDYKIHEPDDYCDDYED